VKEAPLLLVLDGVTDPYNLGACLRVATPPVPRGDRTQGPCAGISAVVSKVASGAAESVPYYMVTNLAARWTN